MTGRRAVIVSAIVVFAAAVTIWIVVATGGGGKGLANSTKPPACQASRIAVSLGPNMKPSSDYPEATQLARILFKNEGPACHLFLGGPVAQAVRGLSGGRLTKSSEASFPSVMPSSFGRVELNKGAKSEALFEVWKTPASGDGNGCTPKTATGLTIGGYALPIGTTRVFLRTLFGVCFASVDGTASLNTEVTWLHLNQ